MSFFYPPIGSFALGLAALIFLVLFVLLWKKNARDNEKHKAELGRLQDKHNREQAELWLAADKKIRELDKKVSVDTELLSIALMDKRFDYLTEDIKKKLILDIKAGKTRPKLPSEEM